ELLDRQPTAGEGPRRRARVRPGARLDPLTHYAGKVSPPRRCLGAVPDHGPGARDYPRAGAGPAAATGRPRDFVKARQPSMPISTAAMTSSADTSTMSPEPRVGRTRPAARLGW